MTASGAILDSASVLLSSVDRPFDADAAYCIRAGYLALRRIADFFGIPYDPDPRPDEPISIERDEFDEACEALAGLTMAPYAPWSSDLSVRDWRPRGSLRELRRG